MATHGGARRSPYISAARIFGSDVIIIITACIPVYGSSVKLRSGSARDCSTSTFFPQQHSTNIRKDTLLSPSDCVRTCSTNDYLVSHFIPGTSYVVPRRRHMNEKSNMATELRTREHDMIIHRRSAALIHASNKLRLSAGSEAVPRAVPEAEVRCIALYSRDL